MTCKEFNKGWNTRHDQLVEAWCIIIERAGCATSLEPLVRDLVPGGIEKHEAFYGKRGDILFELNGEKILVDVSVAHVSKSQSWRLSGAAATARDRKKCRSYDHVPGNYEFVPLSMESYGTMGSPADELLRSLANAAYKSNLTESVNAFISLAHGELSVALCKGNSVLYRCYHDHWTQNAGGRREP